MCNVGKNLLSRTNMHALKSTDHKRQSGFALVVALSLMAFVLMLILSMSLLVQVETTNASRSLDQLRAKEAARLALMMAMGELQKHAGPDQRVTARAEILGDSNVLPETKLWTGVWDTTDTNAAPIWLVSGKEMPNPSTLDKPVTLANGYDYGNDGDLSTDYDVPANQVSLVKIEDEPSSYAWSISDEGVKAPIQPVLGVKEKLSERAKGEPLPDYLDYDEYTLRSAAFLHDPVFDLATLYNPNKPEGADAEAVAKAISSAQIDVVLDSLTSLQRNDITSELRHSATLGNHFVLSDTNLGGLKKDLSFLKTLDTASISDAELNALYADPDSLITAESARLLSFRGEPTAGAKEEMIGMQLSGDTIADVKATTQNFSILPVVTEFQLSGGVAATDGNASVNAEIDSDIFFVNKLYLELWNPYTVPFVIGKSDLAAEQGFSDIRIEIKNLPSFTITNERTKLSVSGALPDMDYLWSDFASEKILRPGMVYLQSLPLDSKGDNDTGVYQTALGLSLTGRLNDTYTGDFTFSDPVEITLFALDSNNAVKELYRFELDNYPNFIIDYDPSDRATWFKRVPTSKKGKFGMNHASLERIGYAFAARFNILDEQEAGSFRDISNWLSKADTRTREFAVDLSNWDVKEAWTDDTMPPYDFTLNSTDFDPGFFDPSESFKATDFFHYNEGSGRKDRIARFIDVPTGEPTRLDLLNALAFTGKEPNPIGNTWGGKLNGLYDRYFFSTLPDPTLETWDETKQPLLHARLKSTQGKTPELNSVDTAQSLLLANGFNVNSTSPLAWEKILAGQNFSADSLEIRYEMGNFYDKPSWFQVPNTINNAFVKFPSTAAFNASEQKSNPRYVAILRDETANYEDTFSIDFPNWQSSLQHPAFFQSFRELESNTISLLSKAVVTALKEFYTANGHPPFSMSEFISSGILEQAIEATSAVNSRSNDFDNIPTYTPSNIDQRTLLSMIGLFSTTRSDTFRIRTFAQTEDPLSGRPNASAVCQAMVQRLPEAHPDARFGRRFQIISFEWLSPNLD